MGQKPTEEELFQMISEVDENLSGSIDFAEFLKVIENQKERAENFDDENDMIDAFVACGGRPDKQGHVKRETLVKIVKHDFGLTIDIEELINKIDTDGSGEIEFEEFKTLLHRDARPKGTGPAGGGAGEGKRRYTPTPNHAERPPPDPVTSRLPHSRNAHGAPKTRRCAVRCVGPPRRTVPSCGTRGRIRPVMGWEAARVGGSRARTERPR